MAIRPATLTASVVPVVVGSSTAASQGYFTPWLFAATLAVALLIQIGSNLANDYLDFRSGRDTSRLGPRRVTQSGLVKPEATKLATIAALGLAVLTGIPVVIAAGWAILVAGLACVVAAVLYTGIGPLSLANHGLGDLAAFLFFGVIGVTGSTFVQTRQLTAEAVLNSLPVGLLIAAILVVNNLRDIESDKAVQKRTLAVMLGEQKTRVEYALLLVVAYLVPLIRFFLYHDVWFWLPWLTLPLAIALTRRVMVESGSPLNRSLARTAQLTLLFGLLFSASLLV